MIQIKNISNKKTIENFYRKNTCLNIYPIGDLDDFFFKSTEWFALIKSNGDDNEILEIAFIYRGSDLPVLLAFCGDDNKNMKTLLKGIGNYLPDKFYAHLSQGLEEEFPDIYLKADHGRHLKMCLTKKNFKEFKDNENIKRLSPFDIDEISGFYERSYPGNWFDLQMLETGKYFGYYFNGELIGAAGIHVYSPEYRVAALGNITTHPEHRGKHVSRNLTSVLCSDLFITTDHIGLNVHSENYPAVKCYENLGFEFTGEYYEITFEKKSFQN